MRTWLTERFGLSMPVVAAPMAGVSTGRLAAAVSAAGGLGMLGAGPTSTPDPFREQCAVAREAGRFGVGLMAWALAQDDAMVDLVVAEGPALVSSATGRTSGGSRPCRMQASLSRPRWGRCRRRATPSMQASMCSSRVAARAAATDALTWPRCRCCRASLMWCSSPFSGSAASARPVAWLRCSRPVRLARGLEPPSWLAPSTLRQKRHVSGSSRRRTRVPRTDVSSAWRSGWPGHRSTAGRALRNPCFDHWVGREDELADDDLASAQLATARQQSDYDVACGYAGEGVGLLRNVRSASAVMTEFAEAGTFLDRACREQSRLVP